jgi:hypothetical protein
MVNKLDSAVNIIPTREPTVAIFLPVYPADFSFPVPTRPSTHTSKQPLSTPARRSTSDNWALNLSSPLSRAHGDVLSKDRAILPSAELHRQAASSSTQTLLAEVNFAAGPASVSAARHVRG